MLSSAGQRERVGAGELFSAHPATSSQTRWGRLRTPTLTSPEAGLFVLGGRERRSPPINLIRYLLAEKESLQQELDELRQKEQTLDLLSSLSTGGGRAAATESSLFSPADVFPQPDQGSFQTTAGLDSPQVQSEALEKQPFSTGRYSELASLHREIEDLRQREMQLFSRPAETISSAWPSDEPDTAAKREVFVGRDSVLAADFDRESMNWYNESKERLSRARLKLELAADAGETTSTTM